MKNGLLERLRNIQLTPTARRILIDSHAAVTGALAPFAVDGVAAMIQNRQAFSPEASLAADAWLVATWIFLFTVNPGDYLGLHIISIEGKDKYKSSLDRIAKREKQSS